MIEFISLARRTALHGKELAEATRRVVESGSYLFGSELSRFEHDYAAYLNVSHCIGVGNGLDALTLIYRAYIEMGVMSPGDEVIVPANTYIASILAITSNGLVPVLVEPRLDTLQIDDSLIERHITRRTKSVMLVHLYGRCSYTPLVGSLCSSYGLRLVEDNAQAHGCRFEGRLTGSLGDAAGHSFYPTKNLGALGDAGAVTTCDDELAAAVRCLHNYGAVKKNVFNYEGRNSRMDELQAAVLNVRLRYLDEENERRRQMADYYHSHIHHPAVLLPSAGVPESHVWHVYPILAPQRDSLREHLSVHGVGTQIHYPIPPHRQRCYGQWNSLALPVTERIHAEELSLPIGPELTFEELSEVVDAVNSFEE